jgi:hypothetical protein
VGCYTKAWQASASAKQVTNTRQSPPQNYIFHQESMGFQSILVVDLQANHGFINTKRMKTTVVFKIITFQKQHCFNSLAYSIPVR